MDEQQPKHLLKKLYLPQILACLLLLIAVYFLRQQRHELQSMWPYLQAANPLWLSVAGAITIVYILLQSGMYVSSFAAVGSRLRWWTAIELFLKRNLLSVFVPGGGVSALAYTPDAVKHSVIARLKIHQASGLFAFAGMLSLFIVGLPVLFLNLHGAHTNSAWLGLSLIAGLCLVMLLFFKYNGREALRRLLQKRYPKLSDRFYAFTNVTVNSNQYLRTITASVGVELCGILHLYLAMLAIGATPSLSVAGVAYITTVLLMVASPFLKGLGAVELSLVYVLTQFGYPPAEALAITAIYRLFEFWLPFVAGVLAFLQKGKVLFLRIVPPFSIFVLGLVNILSVITPPIKERLHWIKELIPSPAIHATNLLVLFIGIVSMVCAAFLIKGLRSAWWLAMAIAALSVIGHLAKAWDYEEASIAGAVLLLLLLTRKQYRRRSNPRLVTTGIAVTLLSFVAVLIYGFVGFYFLEKRHFGMDFTWKQSALYSIRGFLLLDWPLHPLTRFGHQFLNSFHVLGVLAWTFLFITLIKPYLYLIQHDDRVKEKAQALLTKYSHSMLDYFKLAEDKQIFLAQRSEGFVSYTVAGGFAIALEEPVCAPENKVAVLLEFERYCHDAGLKTAFYRIDERSTSYFSKLKKKKLLIGQEAILDVTAFSLTGRERKALRNSLNSLQKKGYTTSVFSAPHSAEFLQQLRRVSDVWLQENGRAELQFSQGAFDEEALQQQDVIATLDADGTVVAFLNIIPDFAPGECTYDLIRKTADAPGGCMDALIIELINYAKARNMQALNLGLAPLSGIAQPQGAAEQVMKLAYEKTPWFRQYRGLRAFKEKYASVWRNKYLVYDNDFDLLQLPNALKKAMRFRPQKLHTI